SGLSCQASEYSSLSGISKVGSLKIPQSCPFLTSREEFEFLTHLVLRNSTGDHASVLLQDHLAGAVRFAHNQIIQHVDTHKIRFLVTIGCGRKHASASTTDLTAGAVRGTLQRAEYLARMAPEDPECLPAPAPQHYGLWPTFRPEILEAGVSGRLHLAREAIEQCQTEKFQAA
ncbi:MAG: hypothetical protein OEY80_13755, partial [Nitrospirota bacterium]|nr:hypothetical protein [Nitrospirota bacterium]